MKKLLFINLIALSLFAADDNSDLFKACIGGNLERATQLIRAGADVNEANKYGNTLLHKATFYRRPVIVKLLINAGAEVNKAASYNGGTPVHVASFCGYEEIVKMLLMCGADKTIANDSGETAFDIAQKYGYHGIAQLLADAPRVLPLRWMALNVINRSQVEVPEWFPPLLLEYTD